MATKKSEVKEPAVMDPEVVEEENRDQAQQLANAMAELKALKEENAKLKMNSVHSASPYGNESDYERVKRISMETAEAHEDAWQVKVSVLAPRIGKGEDSYWLSVNGRTIQVPANDRYFEMALPFAECLVEEIKARKRADDYIDQIEVYDPQNNPHPVEKIV